MGGEEAIWQRNLIIDENAMNACKMLLDEVTDYMETNLPGMGHFQEIAFELAQIAPDWRMDRIGLRIGPDFKEPDKRRLTVYAGYPDSPREATKYHW